MFKERVERCLIRKGDRFHNNKEDPSSSNLLLKKSKYSNKVRLNDVHIMEEIEALQVSIL